MALGARCRGRETRLGRDNRASSSALGVDRYNTEVVTASIGNRELKAVLRELEPALSELWRQFGHPEGTHNVEDGEWRGDSADEPAFP